ncbi:MAG TPA: hypothetical protein VK563_16290 [Puia sp.]|nr:hypothetical protein [Puia sp.]
MDLSTFRSTLTEAKPPAGISGCLLALWHDGKKDWEGAHTIAQDIDNPDGAWVHAYLHRKEGDPGNARYWYNRAGKTMPDLPLEKEWDEIVRAFLRKG